ncbi:MAG: tagaturonate reductase [Lachnospiraceae bacterium]|nr:tagaturonate reductase [Lachnospiraceae bacterium]
MDILTYETLEKTGYEGFLLKDAPERVLQFGEGNFLRAFTDHFIDILNEKAEFNGKVVVVQPRGTGRKCDVINGQDGLYTLLLRGNDKGRKVDEKRVISCISRCINPYREYDAFLKCALNPDLRFIVSNTTEAGIVYDPECGLADEPASSFPGKLTQFLYERFKSGLPGFIILSCELIDRNGDELLKCVLEYAKQWDLPDDFKDWLERENLFCSTLVDRIVPGYPGAEADKICEELGYRDELLDAGEVFASWVIEGPGTIMDEFPADKAGLPIQVVDNVDPYKKRKVRILNGAHTSMVLAAFLAGKDIVRDCMEDDCIRGFMDRTLNDEIIPVLKGLDEKELKSFTEAVFDRFANPFIDHELLSIALNSTAKWKARVMPSLLEYYEMKKELPKLLTFSFAAYLAFYRRGRSHEEGALKGSRGGEEFLIKDDGWVLDEFLKLRDEDDEAFTKAIIDNERMWGSPLKDLPGFKEAVLSDIKLINEKGMYEAMRLKQA